MDSASLSQTFYAGEFRHQLDEKHRVTIPSRWRRKGDSDDLLLVPEQNLQCLLVMSPNEFARVVSSAQNTPGVAARDLRIFLRHVHSRAQHGSADKQGRLLLPDDLCKQLGLKGEVALVGGPGRFEIWNLARWKRAQQEEHSTYQNVANLVGL
jgi:MraZ protein